MKLAAVLACRNQSARLYAKPLQNLDVKNGVTILDYMIAQMRFHATIEEVVLAISERDGNEIYKTVAAQHGVPYVIGSDKDVLARLIQGAELVGAENVFRVTTESPYVCYDMLEEIHEQHCREAAECSMAMGGLPDGSGFEIYRRSALQRSWDEGSDKHRSELCSLYIFENRDKFKLIRHSCRKEWARSDIRLTVDWPEDLVVMRAVYEGLGLSPSKLLDYGKVIEFLDAHPKINAINKSQGFARPVDPAPTASRDTTRKGLRVRKSRTNATTNEEAADWNGIISFWFRTYTYESEPNRAGSRSTNRFRINVTSRTGAH